MRAKCLNKANFPVEYFYFLFIVFFCKLLLNFHNSCLEINSSTRNFRYVEIICLSL